MVSAVPPDAEPEGASVEPPPVEPPPVDAAPVEAPPVIEGYTAEVAAALLDPGWWRGTRIAMARRGAVRLRVDGPDLGLRDGVALSQASPLRVVEDGERPRVVTDDGGVRLLLYVERQDARPVLMRAAALRPALDTVFGDPPQRGHAMLQPGAWVEVTTREGEMVRVTYHEDRVKLSGWVEAGAVGTTMTPGERVVDPRPRYLAKRATGILARPGGKVLTRLRVDDEVIATTRRAENGHRLVEFKVPCRDLVHVGFVRADDLHQPVRLIGTGCGGTGHVELSFGEFKTAPRLTIAAGRFLLDPERPQVVGCVHRPTELAELGEGRYAVATRWGPVPVRLAPDDFAGSCDKERPQPRPRGTAAGR